mmetsp:Transcript_65149/g.132516  ORF Transcript_65149/g.132516 Transcript_65149/m.132516 type:complete len:277 (+) Transcript_65149:75-905(+)
MAGRSTIPAVAACAAAAALLLLCLVPAFVPGASQTRAPPALRAASAAPQPAFQGRTTGAAGAAVAAVAAAAIGASLLRRSRAQGVVAQQVARRDLAIAYEESGISLLDNGKFAQGLVGSEGAWGKYEFDPVGFSKYTEFVPYFREAELKHGRIAMLAWVGLVVPDFVRIPGERYSFEACPITIEAHDKLNGAVGANFQILFWVTIVELCCAKKVFEWNSVEVAGDYGLGTQFLPKDEEGQRKKRLAELKNGRLAMVAFGGSITQAVITQHPFPWLY